MRIPTNLKKRQWQNLISDIRTVAIILAIISTLVSISTNNPINRDGILYIKSAQAFLDSGIGALIKVYKWPFYPLLIAITSKLLYLSLEHSAFLWNIIFASLIVTVYISIIKELSCSKLVQLFALIVIIGHPRLHHWERYITRDLGYWAFLMLSILYIIKYCSSNGWRHVILGWLCLDIATLFRIEGIIFIMLYPLVILLKDEPFLKKIKKIAILYIIRFSILSAGGLICYLKGITIYSSTRLNEISSYIRYFHHSFIANLFSKGKTVGNHILARPAKNYGSIFVLFGLIGIFLDKLFKTVWPLHFALSVYGIKKRITCPKNKTITLIYVLIVLNLAIPIIFLYRNFFLSCRFLMPATLLLLLFVPFVLEYIYINKNKSKQSNIYRILEWLIIFVFIGLFIGAFLPPKNDKAYIRNAGLWIKNNINNNSQIYSDVYIPELSYYSGHQIKKFNFAVNKFCISQNNKKNNIILITNKNILIKNVKQCLKIIKVFHNKKGKIILIIKK